MALRTVIQHAVKVLVCLPCVDLSSVFDYRVKWEIRRFSLNRGFLRLSWTTLC